MLTKFQLLKQGISFDRKKIQKNPFQLVIEEEIEEEESPYAPKIKYIAELNTQTKDKQLNKYSLKLFTYIKNQKIKFKGEKINLPSLSLKTLQKKYNYENSIINSLRKNFNIKKPSIIQSLSFPNILQKRNLIAIAPTGSGKTLGYLAPLVSLLLKNKREKVLIIAPTFEISAQIYKVGLTLLKKGEEIIDLEIGHIANINKGIEEYDILVATPKKFLNMVKENQECLGNYEHIVLDEADKYFEMSFNDQLESILEIFKVNKKTYYLFSATFPLKIEKSLNEIFIDRIEFIIGGKIKVLNTIEQKLVYCSTEEGKVYEIENMINCGDLKTPCLIFLQNKERVYEVFKLLHKKNLHVDYLDSKLTLRQREEKVKKFEMGFTWILITSDLLARGVDFPDLKLVINFDIPSTIVDYVHRVGRTGRAHKIGKAITFFTNDDKYIVRKLADLLKNSGCVVPEWIFSIKKMNQKYFKRLIRVPIERESLSRRKKIKKDKVFSKDIRKKDYFYWKKLEDKEREENEDKVDIKGRNEPKGQDIDFSNLKKEDFENVENGGWKTADGGEIDFN